MAWVRLDDRFDEHPKVSQVGPLGMAVFVAGLCYCNRNTTDGHIPEAKAKLLTDTSRPGALVKKLVDAGLWETCELHDSCYVVHDYLEYQPSADDLRRERSWARQKRELHSDPELIRAIKDRDQDHCRYCGREVSWKDRRSERGATYDHVIPRGPNSLENVVVACRACNSAKGARTPDEAGMPLLPPPGDPDPDPTGNGSRTDPEQKPNRNRLGAIQPPEPEPEPPVGSISNSALTRGCPVAGRIHQHLPKVAYEECVELVNGLRDEGLADHLIDAAVGQAIATDAKTLSYIATVARSWFGRSA